MFDRIISILNPGPAAEPRLETERIQVATCALLLEMGHSDGNFREIEQLVARDLLEKKFDLTQEAVDELIEYAQSERENSHDLYNFAREINEHFSLGEKLEVMETLWRIIYADGVLDKYEDALVKQLTTLLRLSHRQMIDIKVKVLDELNPGR